MSCKIYHCKVKGCRYKVKTGSFRKAMQKMRKHYLKKHGGIRRVRRTAKKLTKSDMFTARELKILKKLVKFMSG